MALQVIGAGVGRTGTNSLRLALNQLGLGPCYHMYEAVLNIPGNFPLWSTAFEGHADWEAIYKGYASAVDWPTSGFVRELKDAYPDAKFILTIRSAPKWAESFSETIYKALEAVDQAPPALKPWLAMVRGIIAKTGFPLGLDVAGLTNAFDAHTEAVKATIPADRLLFYEVKDGWKPLCAFLGVPEPSQAFPRTNARDEFWEHLQAMVASGG